jgi:hypothetical protein
LINRTRFERVINHGHANAVFDAGKRIEKFQLEQDGGERPVFFCRAMKANQWCVADGFRNIVVNTAHKKNRSEVQRVGDESAVAGQNGLQGSHKSALRQE